MDIITKDQLEEVPLPGRHIWKAIGKDGALHSEKMTLGFARFAASIGAAEPHQHAEESIYVLDAYNAAIRWGSSKDALPHSQPLAKGLLLHIPAQEWHVFECGEEGFCEVLFFYAQTDNIRPEDAK